MTLAHKRFVPLLFIPIVILLVPFIAMQFTDEVNWKVFDFIIAGALLFSTTFLVDLVVRKVKQQKYRVILVTCLVVLLVLIWAELAVGIFGSPIAGS